MPAARTFVVPPRVVFEEVVLPDAVSESEKNMRVDAEKAG